MYLKIHKYKGKEIVAVCDDNLVGRSFEDKEYKLELNEYFYKGEKADKELIIDTLKDCKNANLVGKDTIKLALENDLIDESGVKKIKNIPFAMIVSL